MERLDAMKSFDYQSKTFENDWRDGMLMKSRADFYLKELKEQ